jgi:hypothetical protein
MYPITFVVQGTNMMFTAGLMMAIAVEHCGLHHRYHYHPTRQGSSKKLMQVHRRK